MATNKPWVGPGAILQSVCNAAACDRQGSTSNSFCEETRSGFCGCLYVLCAWPASLPRHFGQSSNAREASDQRRAAVRSRQHEQSCSNCITGSQLGGDVRLQGWSSRASARSAGASALLHHDLYSQVVNTELVGRGNGQASFSGWCKGPFSHVAGSVQHHIVAARSLSKTAGRTFAARRILLLESV